jgi:alpha-beta hydrolase superfamily lysophospholipase
MNPPDVDPVENSVRFPFFSIMYAVYTKTIRSGERMMKKRIMPLLSSLLVAGVISCCQSDPPTTNLFGSGLAKDEFRVLAAGIPFAGEAPVAYPEQINAYFRYYGIDFPGVEHRFGILPTAKGSIACHLFVPPGAQRTIVFIHGYLVHSANFAVFIRRMLDAGFAFAAFDLPGHGLSSGKTGDIADFADYTAALVAVIDGVRPYAPPLDALIGQSTGGAIVLDYLLHHESVFHRHIATAPLVRSDMYGASRLGVCLFGRFLGEVHTYPRGNIGDPEADAFLNADPLKINVIPISWVKACFAWNDRIEKATERIDEDLLVIQGTKDTALEWKYNMKTIRKLAPKVDIELVENARHEIYLDKPDIRERVFSMIVEHLMSD